MSRGAARSWARAEAIGFREGFACGLWLGFGGLVAAVAIGVLAGGWALLGFVGVLAGCGVAVYRVGVEVAE